MAALPSTSKRVCRVRLFATERATRDACAEAMAGGHLGGWVQSVEGEGEAEPTVVARGVT